RPVTTLTDLAPASSEPPLPPRPAGTDNVVRERHSPPRGSKQLAVGGQLLHVDCVLDRRCGARRRDYRQRVVADSGLVAEAGPTRGDRGRAPSRRRRRLTARTEQIHETGQGAASVEVVDTRCTTVGIAIPTG